MEVYANSIKTLTYAIYVDGQLVAADDDDVVITIVDDDGEEIMQEPASVNSEGIYSVTIGPMVTSDYGVKTFYWSYMYQNLEVNTQPEYLVVVNPYVSYHSFTVRRRDIGMTPLEFEAVEPIARGIIDVFCNQRFTREDGLSHTILGNDSDSLWLPRRLINLERVDILDPHIDGSGTPQYYDLTQYVTMDNDNRWMVRRKTASFVDRSSSPTHNRRFFKYPSRYLVTGSWGWESVPEDVSKAASILIGDYICADAKWREKYVSNIRAGDWRMEFYRTGDDTTGNANADMILSGYRNLAPAVI